MGEQTEDLSKSGAGKHTAKVTLKFTSDTEGTQVWKITKWTGAWSAEDKKEVQGMVNGEKGLTYTYFTNIRVVRINGIGTFAVNAEKKTLTDKDGVVFKLR
ncbi:MAG: hypothetical protein MdMp014T_0717 [Treponematales bacterium]